MVLFFRKPICGIIIIIFFIYADMLLVINCKHDMLKSLTMASNFILDAFAGRRQSGTVNMTIRLHHVRENRLHVEMILADLCKHLIAELLVMLTLLLLAQQTNQLGMVSLKIN